MATDQLLSKDKGRFYLSYFKIRSHSRNQSGGFYFEAFCNVLGLKARAGRKHINELVGRGFVVSQGNDHFKVVTQRSLFNASKRELYHVISDEELAKFTFANLAEWRALLSELEVERYKRHQKALETGYTIFNDRDKSREKVSNPSVRKWDKLMATTCAAALLKCSASVISKYRRRQNLARYSGGVVSVNPTMGKLGSEGREIDIFDFIGRVFTYKGRLFFSPVSFREPLFVLRRN